MKHLTEDILIQYAFDLLEAEAKASAAAHLAECGECAGQLELLRVQFSAMDVLEAEEVLSDELTARTLAGIENKQIEPRMNANERESDEEAELKPSRALSGGWRRSAAVKWVASAAAVLVVGLAIWSPSLKTAKQPTGPAFKEDLAIVAESESGERYRYAGVRSEKTQEPVVAQKPDEVMLDEKAADDRDGSLGVQPGDVLVTMNDFPAEEPIEELLLGGAKGKWSDKGIGGDTAFGVEEDSTVAAKPESGLSKDNHPALPGTPPLKGGELSFETVGRDAGRSYKAESLAKTISGVESRGLENTTNPPLRAPGDSRTTPPCRAPLLCKEGSLGSLRIVSADAISEAAPFAPASAIELVVLPKPDQTQVTIYNSADLTLVRDTRKLTLKPGWNWLQFMWDNTLIDPTSLSLRPLTHDQHIDIELISYPARLKDIGRWLIRSEVEGAVPFEITYFISGLSWRAFYMGTMNADETQMSLKGYVNVSNQSGQDFVNTQTRVIVGETRLTETIAVLAQRQRPYGPEIADGGSENLSFGSGRVVDKEEVPVLGDVPLAGGLFRGVEVDFAGFGIKAIEKTGLSEYFLYTIEGTEDLTNQWSRRLPSFDAAKIPVKSLYKYDEGRYGKTPVRFVSFANDAEHELGETPMPEGNIKIYRNLNATQNLSYVGGSSFKYIPVNEDVELNLGPARLVKVEPVLMDRKSENYVFNHKGNIDGWDDVETWRMKVTNTRDIAVDIEITRDFETDTWELEYNHPALRAPDDSRTTPPLRAPLLRKEGSFEYKKHDKNRGRFTLTVSPRSEKTFGYTVTKYRGKRGVEYSKKQQKENR